MMMVGLFDGHKHVLNYFYTGKFIEIFLKTVANVEYAYVCVFLPKRVLQTSVPALYLFE